MFHQDSAPSHASIKTLKFLDDRQIAYIKPTEWLANSPDAAPLDYFAWGYLKHQLSKRKASSIASLKRAIVDEVNKMPLETINKALEARPKRVYPIYKAKGHHIEKHR